MNHNDAGISRRGLMRAAAGTTAVAATGVSGTALAQEEPYDGYLSDANGYDGTTADYSGQDEVTVAVGAGSNGIGFNLPAITVDPGTTVIWEWTGEGGTHNVVAENESFKSGDPVESSEETFEYTFEEGDEGVYKYYCTPHKAIGMKGVVAVGDTAQEDTAPASEVSFAESSSDDGGSDSGDGGGGGGGGEPDFGGYLGDANNFDGTADQTGNDEVTVNVGAGSNGLAFGPAAVHVDNGATVRWEWTGEGGAHNVIAEDGAFDSGSPQETGTFEYTFEEDGIYNYYCSPHKGQGMKGAIVVGSEYPTVQTGGDVGPSDLPSSAKALGVATMLVMSTTLGLAYFFTKYGGDYGEHSQ